MNFSIWWKLIVLGSILCCLFISIVYFFYIQIFGEKIINQPDLDIKLKTTNLKEFKNKTFNFVADINKLSVSCNNEVITFDIRPDYLEGTKYYEVQPIEFYGLVFYYKDGNIFVRSEKYSYKFNFI